MSFADRYLARHPYIIEPIQEPPSGLLRFVVVIPAYLEEDVYITLESLFEANLPDGAIEVLLVINFSVTDSIENKQLNSDIYTKSTIWCNEHSSPSLKFFSLLAVDLSAKHAGAGLARKIGMDEAVRRFHRINRPGGYILSLDADTLVSNNYFTEIEREVSFNPRPGGFILNFEHPLQGTEFPFEIYNAIAQYELHLRYYKHILQSTGFPHCFYTIGSCFGVRADVYAAHGGMNRRQAGEDFYFLHKVFPHCEYAEITKATVYPSPRISNRVPFGTGPTMADLCKEESKVMLTYAPQAFYDLKVLFTHVGELFDKTEKERFEFFRDLPKPLQEFINSERFNARVGEIKGNTANSEAFKKRFFGWFDGFMVVKYLNEVSNIYYKKTPVSIAAHEFLSKKGIVHIVEVNDLLAYFRQIDLEEY